MATKFIPGTVYLTVSGGSYEGYGYAPYGESPYGGDTSTARVVPGTVYLSRVGRINHTVPQAVALLAANLRTVPQAVALLRSGFTRTVPQAVALGRFGVLNVVPQAVALARPVASALLAPARPSVMPDLLATLNPLYALDPQAEAMLVFSPTTDTAWRIDGNLIEVAATDGSILPCIMDLRFDPADNFPDPARRLPLTLTRLAALLTAAGYPATTASGWGSTFAIALLDGAGSLDTGSALLGFTTTLWRVLRMMATVLDLIGDDIEYGLKMLDLQQAEGVWLDWWGTLYGVPRLTHEDDAPYRVRVAYLTMKPRVNNVAIEAAILAIFGISCTVDDGNPLGVSVGNFADPGALDHLWSADEDQETIGRFWPGYPPRFNVALSEPADPALIARIADLVNSLRAAGVRYTVFVA